MMRNTGLLLIFYFYILLIPTVSAETQIVLSVEPGSPNVGEEAIVTAGLLGLEPGPVVPAPIINGTVVFYIDNVEIGRNKTVLSQFGDTGVASIKHTFSSAGSHSLRAYYPDDAGYGANNGTLEVNVLGAQGTTFDTGNGSYPSIMGTHNGTLRLNQNLIVNKMYTYPSPDTGGHSEYIRIWNNSGWNTTASWSGYSGDWHNITFVPFTLEANVTYNYTIRTGSYPQIIHNSSLSNGMGTITSTEFIDANGRRYIGWIPAIRLE